MSDIVGGSGGGGAGGGEYPEEDQTQSFSGSSSYTINLDGEYDEVLLILSDVSDFGANVELVLNGDTGSNYDYRDSSASFSGGNAPGSICQVTSGSASRVEITGRWNSVCTFHRRLGGYSTSMIDFGRNGNISSPLTSITLRSSDGSNFSCEVEIRGRNN